MQLLVFVSSRCPYCPKAVSAVEKALPQYKDYDLSYEKIRAKTVKAKEISGKYGIRAYPTIIGLNDSEETVCKIVGVPSEEKL
ncbi:thioredoxin family protein, partial [bacterium]|nr:thioredoxin family protein [bacterium]